MDCRKWTVEGGGSEGGEAEGGGCATRFLGEGDGDNPKWGRRGAVSGGGKPEREQGGG